MNVSVQRYTCVQTCIDSSAQVCVGNQQYLFIAPGYFSFHQWRCPHDVSVLRVTFGFHPSTETTRSNPSLTLNFCVFTAFAMTTMQDTEINPPPKKTQTNFGNEVFFVKRGDRYLLLHS